MIVGRRKGYDQLKKHRKRTSLYTAVYRNNAESLFDMHKAPEQSLQASFYAHQLSHLQSFIEETLEDAAIPLIQKFTDSQREDKAFDATLLAYRYFKSTSDFIDLVRMLSPSYQFSEHIEIFKACCIDMRLLDRQLKFPDIALIGKFALQPDGTSFADVFNQLVDHIRTRCRSQKISDKIRNRQQNVEKRFVTYCNYVDSLFAANPSLAVLRLDLGSGRSDPMMTNHEAARAISKDLDHLLANQRSNFIFEHQIGYIAKLKFGHDAGIYWRLYFFFDAAKLNNITLAFLAKQIGEYWTHVITKGQGAYLNHHEQVSGQQNDCAIGLIHAREATKRAHLLNRHIAYLCQSSQYLKLRLGPAIRQIRKGQAPTLDER